MEQNLVEVDRLLKDLASKVQEISEQKQAYEQLIAVLCKDHKLDHSQILNKRCQNIVTKDASNQTDLDKAEYF